MTIALFESMYECEFASEKSIKALQAEIAELQKEIQARPSPKRQVESLISSRNCRSGNICPHHDLSRNQPIHTVNRTLALHSVSNAISKISQQYCRDRSIFRKRLQFTSETCLCPHHLLPASSDGTTYEHFSEIETSLTTNSLWCPSSKQKTRCKRRPSSGTIG